MAIELVKSGVRIAAVWAGLAIAAQPCLAQSNGTSPPPAASVGGGGYPAAAKDKGTGAGAGPQTHVPGAASDFGNGQDAPSKHLNTSGTAGGTTATPTPPAVTNSQAPSSPH